MRLWLIGMILAVVALAFGLIRQSLSTWKYIWYEETPDISLEFLIFLGHIDGDNIDVVICIWDFGTDIDIYRSVLGDFSLDKHERIFYHTRISTCFLEWNLECVDIKSSAREIFDLFCIEDSIRHKYDFPFCTHDFGIVEIDLFDDSFEVFHLYRFTDFECFAHDDRETSEEIGDDILAREGEYHSSDTRSGKESTRIHTDLFEYDESSCDPCQKYHDEANRRKELAYYEMLHGEGVFYLMEYETHDVRHYEDHEKTAQSDIYMIHPSERIRSK